MMMFHSQKVLSFLEDPSTGKVPDSIFSWNTRFTKLDVMIFT